MRFVHDFGLLIAIFTVALAACRGPARDQGAPATAGPGIVGGEPVNGIANDAPSLAVGAMKITRDLSTEILDMIDLQSSLERCTGVLIDPDIMLTAAHCVVDDQLLASASTGRLLVRGTVRFPVTGQKIEIKRALYHRDFNVSETSLRSMGLGVISENDIAIVLLETPARPSAVPAVLAGTPPGQNKGYDVRIYGFGVTSSDEVNDTDLRAVLRAVDTRGIYLNKEKKFKYDQKLGRGICYGDSGGPHFVRSEQGWVLAGISSSLNNLTESQGDWCRAGSEAVAVGDYLPWIARAKSAIRYMMLESGPF